MFRFRPLRRLGLSGLVPVGLSMLGVSLLGLALPGPLWAGDAPAAGSELIRVSPEQSRQLGIATHTVSVGEASTGRRLPARVMVPPTRIEVVSAPLAGTVSAVFAAYGDSVRAGQPLVRLGGGQVLEAQRDVAMLQSRANLADDSLRRDEALFADGIISATRLALARTAAREAHLALNERQQALARAGAVAPGEGAALSGSGELRAPFAGVVLDMQAQPGARAEAGAALLTLGRLDPLWLDIQASLAQADGLVPGARVKVPGCAQTARLIALAPQLAADSQSLRLRAELKAPAGCVRPFQQLEVEIAASNGDSLVVPTAAVVRHRGETWVLAEASGGFAPVAVTVLDESERGVRIRAPGLAAGRRIAVRGVAALKAAWMGLGGDGQ